MNDAAVGLIGVVAGLAVGNSSKYFGQRRDAWREARAAGLLVLADVRALRAAPQGTRLRAAQRLAATWEAQRQRLATFRRGNYPNGLKAPEWVELADAFAHLDTRVTMPASTEPTPSGMQPEIWWDEVQVDLEKIETRWDEVQVDLEKIETILLDFKHDPGVVGHNIRAGLNKNFRRRRWRE